MDQFELQKLDALLHKLCEDKAIMDGLSIVERAQITGASGTLCSLIGKHLSPTTSPRAPIDKPSDGSF